MIVSSLTLFVYCNGRALGARLGSSWMVWAYLLGLRRVMAHVGSVSTTLVPYGSALYDRITLFNVYTLETVVSSLFRRLSRHICCKHCVSLMKLVWAR